jgi:hypothetical protein
MVRAEGNPKGQAKQQQGPTCMCWSKRACVMHGCWNPVRDTRDSDPLIKGIGEF